MTARAEHDLLAKLSSRGWAVLRGTTDTEVESLSATLGAVSLRTHVRLDPAKGTYLTSPGPVPMHNDHPAVDFISWHCQAQDPDDGAMLLVDMHDVESRYHIPDPAPMLPCPSIKGLDPCTLHPVHDESGWYYPDWHARSTGLDDLVAAVEEAPRTEVHLGPGDALFVANRRILHGRRGLSPDSPRHLVRRWILTTPPGETCWCLTRPLTRESTRVPKGPAAMESG